MFWTLDFAKSSTFISSHVLCCTIKLVLPVIHYQYAYLVIYIHRLEVSNYLFYSSDIIRLLTILLVVVEVYSVIPVQVICTLLGTQNV